MLKIIISEFEKLKRYNVLWFAVFSIAFSAFIAAFQTGRVSTFELYSNNVIWNNYSLVFPFTLVLIGGYIIDREYTDDTLKNILTIPITFRKLLVSKLIVTGLLTIISSIFSFLCTLLLSSVVLNSQNINVDLVIHSFIQILGMNIFNFIAVSPIIAYFLRKKGRFFAGVALAFFYGFCGIFVAGRNLTDFYPITAGLGIIQYTGQGGAIYNPIVGAFTLLLTMALTTIIVAFSPSYDKIITTSKKKSKKHK